jgi:hypothetical protein
MGWNSWNTFGEKINEQVVLETADLFVKLGLKDAGYEYIVIDDCWSLRERDPKTNEIVPDPVKFPRGMKFVSDYIHKKGLKFGMYSCASTRIRWGVRPTPRTPAGATRTWAPSRASSTTTRRPSSATTSPMPIAPSTASSRNSGSPTRAGSSFA